MLAPSCRSCMELVAHLVVSPVAQAVSLVVQMMRLEDSRVQDRKTVPAWRNILTHSKFIWERIKGALGVPPELDFDP